MRALRVTDRGTSLVEVAVPDARGEALVRVTMSGICNTDLEISRGYAAEHALQRAAAPGVLKVLLTR